MKHSAKVGGESQLVLIWAFQNAWHGLVYFTSALLLGPRHPSRNTLSMFSIILISPTKTPKNRRHITCPGTPLVAGGAGMEAETG